MLTAQTPTLVANVAGAQNLEDVATSIQDVLGQCSQNLWHRAGVRITSEDPAASLLTVNTNLPASMNACSPASDIYANQIMGNPRTRPGAYGGQRTPQERTRCALQQKTPLVCDNPSSRLHYPDPGQKATVEGGMTMVVRGTTYIDNLIVRNIQYIDGRITDQLRYGISRIRIPTQFLASFNAATCVTTITMSEFTEMLVLVPPDSVGDATGTSIRASLPPSRGQQAYYNALPPTDLNSMLMYGV